MPVDLVHLGSEAFLVCMNHALSTEREEIMGLLLGRTAVLNSRKHLHVESVVILQRSDRKADRVEISPLQLAQAAQEAEMLSQNLGRTIRVLGWYHSHPHITVGPSHVDVRTQGMYQMMDDDFVGLIFSAFRKEGDGKFADTAMIGFQSQDIDDQQICREIPVVIAPQCTTNQCLTALGEIPQTLYKEEKDMYNSSLVNGADIITELHNKAVYIQTLCQLVESCEMPCISALGTYEKSLDFKLSKLRERKRKLEERAANCQ